MTHDWATGIILWMCPANERCHYSVTPYLTCWAHTQNDPYTETEMSSFWRNFRHWLHWKLSFWQLSVQPVMKISSKWWHFRKCHHFDEIFVTGCTESCHFDNFRCSQWWKFHQNDDIFGNVIILTKFSSLAALKVVILTTFGAASDENFIKMMTFSLQCRQWQIRYVDQNSCKRHLTLSGELWNPFC